MNELPLYDIDIYGSWETFIEFWKLMEKPIIIYKNEKYKSPEDIIEYQVYYIRHNNFISGISLDDILGDDEETMLLRFWEASIDEEYDIVYFDLISNFYENTVKVRTYLINLETYNSSDGWFDMDWLKDKDFFDSYYMQYNELLGTPQEELITLVYNKIK